MPKAVKIDKISIGGKGRLGLIAGPCVIENKDLTFKITGTLKKITTQLGIPFIFKASYDKGNRTSVSSYRGLGLKEGLAILREVKQKFQVPILSDVHSVAEVKLAAGILDVIQIPAFLCRQTDLLLAAGSTQKPVNIKKGQFLAPWDIEQVVKKIESTGNRNILLTERGVSFGYNQLVSDFRSLAIMRKTGYPVVFDASHSVQEPGGLGKASGGNSEFIPLLARCAVAAGCDAVFMEVHPFPPKALSDGPNMLRLDLVKGLLEELKAIDSIVRQKKV